MPRQVKVRGSTAYLADLHGGLRIIDVADPAAPVEIGQVPGVYVEAVGVVGGIAYLEDVGELRIVDVSDASAPRQIGALAVPDQENVVDIEVEGRLAFLAAGRIGLVVADVSEPAAPRLEGRLLTREWALGVELAGGRAYVADLSGFSVIDASRPAFPREVGRLGMADPSDNAEGVEVSNGIALVGQNAFVSVVDVSDPAAPVELARIEGLGSDPGPDALLGDIAYVRGEGGLHILDLSDPTQPVPVGRHPKSAAAVEVRNGIAFAVGPEDDALDLIDVSDPTAPTTLGTLGGFLHPSAVTVDRDIAYVGDISGLRLIDVGDPAAPAEIGSVGLPGGAEQVAVLGTRAYVVSQFGSFPDSGRLHVIDVSDPTAPGERTAVRLPANPHGVAVLPGRVFVGEEDGIRIFSLSADDSLTDLGAFATGAVAWDLELSGGRVYAAFEEQGLGIVDFGPEHGQVAQIEVDANPARGASPRSRRRVTVSVLGSEWLDASAIDPATLRLGPGEATPLRAIELRDGNRDGFLDLLARFRWRDTEIGSGARTVCLHGRLRDGTRFQGCDAELPQRSAPPPRARER